MGDAATDTADLQGRKRVRLRLRPNLLLVPQEEAGRRTYVLKDPVSLRYYRLDERQHFLVNLMDGARTLEEIRLAYETAYRPDRLSLDELEAFAVELLNGGLVQNESPLAGRLLYRAAREQRWTAIRSALLQFLWIRIPLFDPDRLLGQLLRALPFVRSPAFLALGLALVAAAVGLVASHWDEFLRRLPAQREFFSPYTLLYLWLALGLVKIVHELGHGLCCKAFGGEVHETGVLLLMFFPALYCDVSDSWKVQGRWRRMAVSAAGIYVDLLAAGLATFVWWASDPSSLLHNLCLGVMVVCGVNSVVVNANPLMHFDGYYVLADWLGVPNLAEVSRQVLTDGALRWLGVNVPVEGPAAGRRRLVACYGAASYVYRWAVIATSFCCLYLFLQTHKLGSVCLMLAAGAVLTMVACPFWCVLRAVQQRGGFRELRPGRAGLVAGVVLAALVVAWTAPFPSSVEGVALLEAEPDEVERIVMPPSGGFLRELLVRDGQRVQEGDVLAVLANPKLEIDLRLTEADQALRLQQQGDQVAYLAETTAAKGGGELQQTEYELQALRHQDARLKKQRGQLTLRAGRGGVVMGLASREQKGRWLDGGAELCRIGNDRSLRAVLLLEPADRELVHEGSPVRLRLHGCGARSWPGQVQGIAQVEARNVPPQLSNRAGGEVPTQQDPVSRQEQPRSQHFLLSVQLARPERLMQPGLLGRVRIDTGSRTLWSRARRYLGTTLSWGL